MNYNLYNIYSILYLYKYPKKYSYFYAAKIISTEFESLLRVNTFYHCLHHLPTSFQKMLEKLKNYLLIVPIRRNSFSEK